MIEEESNVVQLNKRKQIWCKWCVCSRLNSELLINGMLWCCWVLNSNVVLNRDLSSVISNRKVEVKRIEFGHYKLYKAELKMINISIKSIVKSHNKVNSFISLSSQVSFKLVFKTKVERFSFLHVFFIYTIKVYSWWILEDSIKFIN